MKSLVFFCLLLIQSSSWSQSDTARFVIRTYGFASWGEYDQVEDSIASNWKIDYLPVAGCVITDEFVDSIRELNKKTYRRLETNYGPDWKERLKQEVNSAYIDLRHKKENTFRETTNCTSDQYSFKAAENMIQNEVKFTVIPKKSANRNNQDVHLIGLQNIDPSILYCGYENLIALEFGSLSDTLRVSLRGKGQLALADSCPTSKRILLKYRAVGSVKQDTILVETAEGKIHKFIFNLKYLAPSNIYINQLPLNNTFSISKLNTPSVLSIHYDKTCLVPSQDTILSWELWYSGGNESLKGDGSIIPTSVIRKLQKSKPGTHCSISVKVIGPDSVQRKKSADFKMI